MNSLALIMTVVAYVCVSPLVARSPVPSANLIRKWRQLFDYMDLDTKGSPQALTMADYTMFKKKLENSSFKEIAKDVANMYYLAHITTKQMMKRNKTKEQYITGMTQLYKENMLSNKTSTMGIYDLLVDTQVDGAQQLLQKDTMVKFEAAIGQLSEDETTAYLNKITSARTITKKELVKAVMDYLSNPDTSLESMPLFGPYTGPAISKGAFIDISHYPLYIAYIILFYMFY